MVARPSLSTNIAEFILANACHVIAASCSLQHTLAFETSFVLKVSFEIFNFVCLTLPIMNGIYAFSTKDHATIWTTDCLILDERNETFAVLDGAQLELWVIVYKLNSLYFS
jgi:hypothetical protein